MQGLLLAKRPPFREMNEPLRFHLRSLSQSGFLAPSPQPEDGILRGLVGQVRPTKNIGDPLVHYLRRILRNQWT